MRNFLTLTAVLFVIFAASSLFAGKTVKADTSALTSVETEAAFFYNADVSKLDTTKSADRTKYRSVVKAAKKRFNAFATRYSALVTVNGSTVAKMAKENKKLQTKIANLKSGKADADLLITAFANRGAVAIAATSDTTVSQAQRVEALNFLLNPDTYQDGKKLNAKGDELKKQYLPVGLKSIPTKAEVVELISNEG